MKKIAIMIHSAPHGTAKGREGLDLALSLSDINDISVILAGDGLFHLLPNQKTETILMRNYIATFKMLDLYDIKAVYACQASLHERNLTHMDFNIEIKPLDAKALIALLAKQDVILQY